MPATYRVYVLQNREGKFYVGLSDDVARRIEQHNSGLSRWTKGKGPWKLVWQSESLNLSEARKLELLLKRQKGGAGFYQLTGIGRIGTYSRNCGTAGSNPAPATNSPVPASSRELFAFSTTRGSCFECLRKARCSRKAAKFLSELRAGPIRVSFNVGIRKGNSRMSGSVGTHNTLTWWR